MTIGAIARRTKGQAFTIQRASAFLYGPSDIVADGMVSAGSNDQAFYVELRFADLVDDSGELVVHGRNQAGTDIDVMFYVEGPGRYLSTRSSDKLVWVYNYTQTGLVGGTVAIRSVNGSGQPIDIDINSGSFQGYLDRSRVAELLQASGNVPIQSGVIYADPRVNVTNNDIIDYDGEKWEVKAVTTYTDRNGRAGYKQIIVFAPGQN